MNTDTSKLRSCTRSYASDDGLPPLLRRFDVSSLQVIHAKRILRPAGRVRGDALLMGDALLRKVRDLERVVQESLVSEDLCFRSFADRRSIATVPVSRRVSGWSEGPPADCVRVFVAHEFSRSLAGEDVDVRAERQSSQAERQPARTASTAGKHR